MAPVGENVGIETGASPFLLGNCSVHLLDCIEDGAGIGGLRQGGGIIIDAILDVGAVAP